MCKCEKGEGLRSGRSEGAPTNLEMVGPKDLGEPQKITGMRKRDGHVYPTESFCKNAVFTSNAWEYILFNLLTVQTLMKGNKHDRVHIYISASGSSLLDQEKNKLSLFSSFK